MCPQQRPALTMTFKPSHRLVCVENSQVVKTYIVADGADYTRLANAVSSVLDIARRRRVVLGIYKVEIVRKGSSGCITVAISLKKM